MPLKFTFAALLLLLPVLSLAQPSPKPSALKTLWGDQSDGTFVNPIIPADFSDIDAIRVGDDYYATSSTFQFSPGEIILHSRDLVNWSILGHAVNDVTRIGPQMNWDTIEPLRPRHLGRLNSPPRRQILDLLRHPRRRLLRHHCHQPRRPMDAACAGLACSRLGRLLPILGRRRHGIFRLFQHRRRIQNPSLPHDSRWPAPRHVVRQNYPPIPRQRSQ